MTRPRLVAGIGATVLGLLAAATAFALVPETPAVRYSGIENRTLVWVAAQFHILFAAFILGAPIFIVICEWIGMRTKDMRYERLAKEVTKVTAILYSMTALTGGLLILMLLGLYPDFTSFLVSYFFPIFGIVYPALFIGETILLYLYWYSWDSLSGSKKGRHVAIGVMLNLVGTATLLVIGGPTSFMNTPPTPLEEATLLAAVANYSWMPLNLHRLVGNVTFGGFITGLIAAYMYMSAKTPEERAHYDWMGFIGNLIGVGSLLLLPLMGYVLAAEFFDYDASIGPYMMADQLSMYFEMQGVMISLIFLASNYYIWLSLKRIEIPAFQTGVSRPLIAAILSGLSLGAGLGHFYAKKAGTGFTFLVVQVGAWVGITAYLMSIEHELGLKILLLLIPFVLWIVSVKSAAKAAGEKTPMDRSAVSGVFWALGRLFLGLERLVLTNRQTVVKFGFIIVLFGSAIWMTPHAFSPTQAGANEFNELPSDWGFLALMPAKNTAAALIVLITIINYILYNRAISRGTISWGKIDFVSQFVLIFLAFSVIWTMGLMGAVRSLVRKYFHVYIAYPDMTPESYTPTLAHASLLVTLITVGFYLVVSLAIWMALGMGKSKAKEA